MSETHTEARQAAQGLIHTVVAIFFLLKGPHRCWLERRHDYASGKKKQMLRRGKVQHLLSAIVVFGPRHRSRMVEETTIIIFVIINITITFITNPLRRRGLVVMYK